jgi:hypothetical protein
MLIVAVAVLVNRLEDQIGAASARVAAAEQQAQAATRAANEQMTAARESAAAQIAEARTAALKAQTTSDVLAAPDLVRYNLIGGNGVVRSSAQVLWSRSRGFVFSATRLPAPAARSTYQIWLLTPTDPVSAGTFVPDESGRFTLVTDTPPRIPRPVTGITVTIEAAGGSAVPTGPTVLARAPQP